MSEITTSIPKAEALERRLRESGHLEGWPPHIDTVTRAIDAHACRRLICPGCHRRGMGCKYFSDGRDYRVLAVCAKCGAGEEM